MVIDLDAACTQEQFGQLVGIGQPAVSDLVSRGVLRAGDRIGLWLLAYAAHLRAVSAGRGADGELARERTRLASAQAEKVERQNKIDSGEYAPVDLIQKVLAEVCRSLASALEALPVTIHRNCPEIPDRALDIVRRDIKRACDQAVQKSVELLDQPDADPTDADDTDELDPNQPANLEDKP